MFEELETRRARSASSKMTLKAKKVARGRRDSLAELCHRGLQDGVASESSDKPWMKYAGMIGGRSDDSTRIDEVVYDRDRP